MTMTREDITLIKPDPQDYAEIERSYGQLPRDASDEQAAERYRLAQAHKLIREFAPPHSK
jgi:hypothetical protein